MLIWDSTVFTTLEIKGHDSWIIVWMTTPGSTIKNKPGQPEVGVELTSPNLAKLAVLLRGILPKGLHLAGWAENRLDKFGLIKRLGKQLDTIGKIIGNSWAPNLDCAWYKNSTGRLSLTCFIIPSRKLL